MPRRFSAGAGLAAAAALVLAQTEAHAAPCPDAATVHAARLVEFQTMMMDVSVRCNHVGVTIGAHITDMSAAHHTMFAEAHERVASFLRGIPAAAPPPPPAAVARIAAARPAKPRPGVSTPASKPPVAKISRRTDPYDRYLTMIGNQYGAGITTLQRCKAFDAIALSLSDAANTDRLLTMVSESLISVTLLEAMVNCPPGK